MIDHNTPVTEGELHVYVDGELPADRREAVEMWLSTHPEDAARYEQLKYELAKRFPADREAYTEAKTEFIREILARAGV